MDIMKAIAKAMDIEIELIPMTGRCSISLGKWEVDAIQGMSKTEEK